MTLLNKKLRRIIFSQTTIHLKRRLKKRKKSLKCLDAFLGLETGCLNEQPELSERDEGFASLVRSGRA